MNARILELIQNPDIIQSQDLDLLKSEVQKHPYLQSIRALQLIGNHHFNSDNYQKELSITAAYTTDKKILYQLINKKKLEVVALPNDVIINDEKSADEIIKSEETTEEISPTEIEKIEFEPKETAKPVFVEGVLNRILFEGEEDFLERETGDIDIEATLESGKLVTREIEKKDLVEEKPEDIGAEPIIIEKEIPEFVANENFETETIINEDKIVEQKKVIEDSSEISFQGTEEFLPEVIINPTEIEETKKAIENESVTAETIINEDKIVEEKEVIEDSSEISFHSSAEFMPDVQIKTSTTSQPKYEAPKPQLSKQDEEMQRLIAEVEAKMKASKKSVTKEIEPIENADVNFSSTQEFVVESTKTEEKAEIKTEVEKVEVVEESKEIIEEEKPQTESVTEKKAAETQNNSWKPMSISAPTPDSLIEKKTIEKKEEIVNSVSEKKEIPAIIETEKTDDRPVFNVSFFTPNVSSIESKKPENNVNITEEKSNSSEEPEKSNIPVFINTWQNWLKIERKEEISDKVQQISKEAVIEKFIEKEPKISKLKDESDFVVKEKGSNISHLMTETLANLYVEQKLYSKAIKAYEILIEKHPQKEAIFNEKISEIKDQRKNS